MANQIYQLTAPPLEITIAKKLLGKYRLDVWHITETKRGARVFYGHNEYAWTQAGIMDKLETVLEQAGILHG